MLLLPKGGLWNEIIHSFQSYPCRFSPCRALTHEFGCGLANGLSMALGSSSGRACTSWLIPTLPCGRAPFFNSYFHSHQICLVAPWELQQKTCSWSHPEQPRQVTVSDTRHMTPGGGAARSWFTLQVREVNPCCTFCFSWRSPVNSYYSFPKCFLSITVLVFWSVIEAWGCQHTKTAIIYGEAQSSAHMA